MINFKKIFSLAGIMILIGAVLGCGVRGKPQPPLSPPELGRGQPTFKRATEEFAFPNVPSPEASPDTRKSRPGGQSVRDSDED